MTCPPNRVQRVSSVLEASPVITIAVGLEPRMETLACSGCGATLPDGSQLCSNCGEKCGEKCREATSVVATVTVIDVPATVAANPRTLRQPAWPLPRRRHR